LEKAVQECLYVKKHHYLKGLMKLKSSSAYADSRVYINVIMGSNNFDDLKNLIRFNDARNMCVIAIFHLRNCLDLSGSESY